MNYQTVLQNYHPTEQGDFMLRYESTVLNSGESLVEKDMFLYCNQYGSSNDSIRC